MVTSTTATTTTYYFIATLAHDPNYVRACDVTLGIRGPGVEGHQLRSVGMFGGIVYKQDVMQCPKSPSSCIVRTLHPKVVIWESHCTLSILLLVSVAMVKLNFRVSGLGKGAYRGM